MPRVDPRDHNMPHDWRTVWTAFEQLKAVAKAAGIHTVLWRIDYPSTGFGRLRNPWWTMTINQPGERLKDTDETRIGKNGTEAAAHIRNLVPMYAKSIVRWKQKTGQPIQVPKKKDPEKEPPSEGFPDLSKIWHS